VNAETVYLDHPTPPGNVPPAPLEADREPYATARERGDVELEVIEVAPPVGEEADLDHGPVLADFRALCGAKGNPRIALLLNRELSDDVREWDVAFGVAQPESATGRVLHESGAKETEEWRGEYDAGRLHNLHLGPAPDGGRNSPAESWMWRFEQGFTRPFLETSCSVVDRATIVRLRAARSARTGVEYTGIAAKKVEMDALAEHADVYVEALVTRDDDTATGYRFKATAKEVATGRILAVVSSPSGEAPTRLVATENGYSHVAVPPGGRLADEFLVGENGYEREVELPSVEEVSEELAHRLMEALTRVWS
jgi:hypothetical protein